MQKEKVRASSLMRRSVVGQELGGDTHSERRPGILSEECSSRRSKSLIQDSASGSWFTIGQLSCLFFHT